MISHVHTDLGKAVIYHAVRKSAFDREFGACSIGMSATIKELCCHRTDIDLRRSEAHSERILFDTEADADNCLGDVFEVIVDEVGELLRIYIVAVKLTRIIRYTDDTTAHLHPPQERPKHRDLIVGVGQKKVCDKLLTICTLCHEP